MFIDKLFIDKVEARRARCTSSKSGDMGYSRGSISFSSPEGRVGKG